MFFQAWFYSLNFGPKTFVAWNVMESLELYTNPPAPVGAKGRVFPEALATGSFS